MRSFSKLFLVIITSVISLLAVNTLNISNAGAAKQTNVKQLIFKAEQYRLQSKELGFEWTTTGELIFNAEEALQAGKKEQARDFAERAIKQAKSAIKQAKFAQQNWQNSAL